MTLLSLIEEYNLYIDKFNNYKLSKKITEQEYQDRKVIMDKYMSIFNDIKKMISSNDDDYVMAYIDGYLDGHKNGINNG